MQQFNVGDWVDINEDIRTLAQVKELDSDFNHRAKLYWPSENSTALCSEMNYYKPWQPKQGEWCWFYDKTSSAVPILYGVPAPSPSGIFRSILFANIMVGIIMVVTNKSIVKSHLNFTKFVFILLVIKLIISCKKNTFVHSAKSCHYAAALSTEDTYSLIAIRYTVNPRMMTKVSPRNR